MDTGNNNLQPKANASGKGMVDNEETASQGLPRAASRPIRGLNWTAILAKAGLESPGYKETVEKMQTKNG